jgi:hypothetical protein
MSRPRKGGRRRERVAQGCGSPAVTGMSSGLAASLSPHRASDKEAMPGETFRPPDTRAPSRAPTRRGLILRRQVTSTCPGGKGDHHGC